MQKWQELDVFPAMVEDKTNQIQPLFIREKDAARLLSVTISALAKWRQLGRVPYFDLKEPGTDHGAILYNVKELMQWIEKHRRGPPV